MRRVLAVVVFAFATLYNVGAQDIIGAGDSDDFPFIDEKDIHGSLIAEGNCVYIPTDSPFDYEQAGQQRLKEYVEKWGYWKVVPKPEQAHFVLQFTTQTSGSDVSYLIIRPRKYYNAYPSVYRNGMSLKWNNPKDAVGIVVNSIYSNEDLGRNAANAERLVQNLRQAITEPNSKSGKYFYRYNGKYLDADGKSNNSTIWIINA